MMISELTWLNKFRGSMSKLLILTSFFHSLFVLSLIHSQTYDTARIVKMITRMKDDPRGPYFDIRWFCQDGTIREARDPCPTKPGNQRARYKPEIIALAENEHIFLGQILATTPGESFWDEANAHSRLKQYQLEKYLRNIDNGWINRKAQFYRGAMQDEDEHKWGIDFYKWLLADADRLRSQYFLIRQSAIDIPHAAGNNDIQLVRALSTEIAETYPSFQDLRVKIHGMPEVEDRLSVIEYMEKNTGRINESMSKKFEQLLDGMEKIFRPFYVSDFRPYAEQLPEESASAEAMAYFMNRYPTMDCPPEQCQLISKTSLILRRDITQPMSATARLAIIDISLRMERLLNYEFTHWKIEYLSELLEQVRCLSEAAAAFGYLELWEWDEMEKGMFQPVVGDTMSMLQLSNYSENGRKVSEWSTAMVRAHYKAVIDLFSGFEPMANGFYDDRVRSSVLLHLGRTVTRLGDEFSIKAGLSNDVLGIRNQSSIHGLNPGFAKGELVVVTGSADLVNVSPDKIYVFHQPPSNLKPVAGIATVTEGNTVSHIQLLARNLGIPNAVISGENMNDLKKYSGKEIFYAVSPKGTVIMKPVSKMTKQEEKLFEKRKRSEEKISVPVEKIQLHDPRIIDMKTINATYSGRISGPKAANLGQLKQIFPQNVVEGIVLPFSIFREHMNQKIPGEESTYWVRMIRIFDHADCMRCSNYSDAQVESYILEQLAELRSLIQKMPLLPSFRNELQKQFLEIFGKPIGNIPVFVRSDTNMEDLKDFTGAGLNLTVFNVVDEEKIFQGIKDVWASPYSERSYKWRQRYLNNPENVFPSIVIIPSVDADHSGVMITRGMAGGKEDDLTVAFNYGVGGAVDGQAAESWLLKADGEEILISPARESSYRAIPSSGGSVRKQASFEKRILSDADLESLREMAADIRDQLSNAPGMASGGPYDIELGFKDGKIWLFQVRPFVENKMAASTDYLNEITPAFDGSRELIL